MTIYVGTAGLPLNVLRDLSLILTADMGLEVDQNPSRLPAGSNPGQAVQVRYDQTIVTPIHDRIFDMVTDTRYDVLIAGLRSNDPVPAAGNQPVWMVGGFTFVSVVGPIVIFYDAQQCNGEGVWVMGFDGQPIDAFTTDGLFHELSHAYHFGIGDNVNPAVDETVAITDENVLRQLFGMPQRDPSNHNGGCNRFRPAAPSRPNEPTNTETSTFGRVECFIASAAYGDGNADEVNRLRYLRDKYFRRTAMGERLFEQFSQEYYRFSPQVARFMHADKQFRTVVTQTLVRPLFAFLTMADALLTHGAESEQFCMAVDSWAARFRRPGEWSLDDCDRAADLKSIVQAMMRSISGTDTTETIDVAGVGDPQTKTIVSQLQWLAGRIEQSIGQDSYLGWMLCEPVSLAWDFIAACHCRPEDESIHEQVRQAVRSWVSRLPLGALVKGLPEDTIESDFQMLKEILFSDPITYSNVRAEVNKNGETK